MNIYIHTYTCKQDRICKDKMQVYFACALCRLQLLLNGVQRVFEFSKSSNSGQHREFSFLNVAIMLEGSLQNYFVRVCKLLHIHSGTGYLVTSLPALIVLSSGCPKDSLCNSFMILLNSASGREELRK